MGLSSTHLESNLRRTFFVAVTLALAACSGSTTIGSSQAGTDPVGTTATQSIGTSGGTLGTSSGDATVNIPSGAMATTTNLTVAVVSASQASATSTIASKVASSVYDFTPSGTQFTKPVNMAIKSSAAPAGGEQAVLAYLDANSQTWQVIPNSTYDASTGVVTAPVSHFTIFAVIIVASDGTGCSEQLDPNAYCAPQICSSAANKCAAIPATFTLGGTVAGLTGSVTLTDAAAGSVIVAADGNFVLPNALPAQTPYAVTVSQQPAGQVCSVVGGQGSMAAADVDTITVSCTSWYAVGGAVSGMLDGGSVGLANGNDTLTVAGNTNFTFGASEAQDSPYLVTVVTQPNYQTCVVANANGLVSDANVTNVAVVCSNNNYTLGGHVTGLRPDASLTLNNGNDTLNANNGAYTFAQPVTYGSNYNVTFAVPSGYACAFSPNVVSDANMTGGAVTNIDVTCALLTYTLGGAVSGLVDGALVGLANGVDNFTAGNGNYTFATALNSEDPYDVFITSPAGEDCNFDFNVVSQGNMPTANVGGINVVCVPLPYHLAVSVSGLVLNANVLVQNGNDTLHAANGNSTFPTEVAFGANYNVTFMPPAGQSCHLGNGAPISGPMPAHDVNNLLLACSPNTYYIDVSVSGLVNNVTVSLFSGGDTPVVGNGNFNFSTPVAFGSSYNVNLSPPPGETCWFGNGNTMVTGSVGAAAIALTVTCAPVDYAAGGAVSGLLGITTVTLYNGNDTVTTGNGNYWFPTSLPFGVGYNAWLTAPAGQTCTWSASPNGVVGAQNVSLNVTCAPELYPLGGTVTGLAGGANVTLTNNGTSISVGNGNYVFAAPVAYDSNYAITLGTPAGHSCAFSGSPNGVMGPGGGSVPVICTPLHYSLGVAVSGLTGNSNASLTNGSDVVSAGNGNYLFPTSLSYGASYNANVTAPAGQVCTYSGSPNGTVSAGNVTLGLTCAPRHYSVIAAVSGLVSNTNVTLTNGNDTLHAANGNTLFPTQVAFNSNYAVSIASPTAQTCAFVTIGNGTVGAANVIVAIACVPNTFAIAGTISGLLSNTNVTLQNGSDTVATGNGSYTLPTNVAYGANYNINVASPVGQTCAAAVSPNGVMGPAALTVNVNCTTNKYTLFASVSGLVANANVSLTNLANADNLSLGNGNAPFPTQVPYNSNYAVTPGSVTGQTCVVASPNGTFSNTNVTLSVTCTPNPYALSGSISGLINNVSLSLQNGNDLLDTGNGSYMMPLSVAYNSNYAITYQQPIGQTCTIANANGMMGNANITNINITCTTNTYTIRGTVAGLVANANVVLGNGSDSLHVVNGNYNFPTKVPYQGNYNISFTPPMGQNCNVIAGETLVGIMSVGDINVSFACQPNTYSVGGQVAGLVTAANVTIHNGSDALSRNNGAYVLPTLVPFASAYAVTAGSATGQTCQVANPNGTMGAAPVTNANITCTPNYYSLVGNVSGLVAGQVTLLNGNDTFPASNGNTLFPTQVAYNSNYAVTFTNPSGQHCSVASPNGVMSGGNVIVAVVCSPNTYSISGSVVGLVNNANVTMHNGNDSVALYNGSYSMPTLVAYNSNYALTVLAPAGQVCTLGANANGTMSAANVTGVNASCSQLSYPVSGAVSGLVNNANVLISNGSDANVAVGDGNYTLPTSVVYNGNFSVSLVSPTGQTCTAVNPNGHMGAGVQTVNIGCTQNPYSVGGPIIGLINNTNVTIYNGNDVLSATNGNYVMPKSVPYFSSYALTLAAPVGQLCAFANNPNGVMQAQNVTNMEIDCQPATYIINGSISGLVNGQVGLISGSDDIQVGNTNFMLPSQIAYQSTYSVSVSSPSGQTCSVTSGAASGTMGAGNVTLAIGCTPKTYAVGGSVTGLLANTNVSLYNGNDIVSSPNGVYTMPTPVAYYSNYNVTLAQPVGQTCSLNANHAGVMSSKAVTNANVTCVQNTYTLSGTVSGLINGAAVYIKSGNDNVPTTNGNFTLPTPITYAQNYNVSLGSVTGQNCSITGGAPATATMGPANVGNILISCWPKTYTFGGNVAGLVANANVAIQSPNDLLSTPNGNYNMPVSVAYSGNYNYTVTPPTGQTCTYVSSGNTTLTGIMSSSSVHNANVVCAPISYPVGGTVTGLLPGTTVTLANGNDTPAVGNGSFQFPTSINFASNYNATISQPIGQSCSFVANSNAGTVSTAAAVGNINVTCTPLTYTLGGAVSGLILNGNVTVTNGLNAVSLSNGSYTFATPVAYTSAYNIGISSPPGQNCNFNVVGAGNGNMPANNLSDRNITCAPIAYTLGGAVVGLLANTNVTLYSGNDNIPAANGNYVFPTPILYGSNYNVTLANPIGHTCVFANANDANMVAGGVANLNVNCNVNLYAVGGSVTNLTGTVVLGNGNDTLSVTGSTFTMPTSVAYHGNYNVRVKTQPNGQLCSVASGSGTVQAANVTTVAVTCVNAYAIGGRVTGLPVDSNVQLASALSSDTLNVSWLNPNFMMPQVVADTSNYNVVVATRPPGLVCTPSNNSGTLAGGNITNVVIACSLQLSFLENQNAVLVVGQSSYTDSSAGTTGTSLRNPSGPVYMTADGNVYVSDTGNKRLLGFAGRPTSNGQAAAFVIGQADFNSSNTWSPNQPRANTNAAQGGSGNGNVTAFADSYSSRVLIYSGNPNNGASGVIALGQPDLVTGTSGCSATKMNGPAAVFVNNGNFFVADTKNHRVLIWLEQPSTSGQPADIVLGQPDMNTSTLAASPNPNNFNSPGGLWVNSQYLFVADTLNNRVLVWDLPGSFPFANQTPANTVIGQADGYSNDPSDPTSTLYQPGSVVSDGVSLFVAERFNNRVSAWGPLNAPELEYVLGQSNVGNTTCNAGTSAQINTLCNPAGIAVVGTSLYVTDYGNNRVTLYQSN